jgi:hypothetical protein
MAESEEIDVLGFEYAQAAKRLREHQAHAQEQARATDPDLTKLHRSAKAKSGFVGVYSNGNGFRAEGRDPHNAHGVVTIGSFKTAELAALARLKHHQRHKLPYGELEMAMEHMLKSEPETRRKVECGEWSMDRLKHEVIWTHANTFKEPLPNLTDEERALENVDPWADS